jgi:hypothetical protein
MYPVFLYPSQSQPMFLSQPLQLVSPFFIYLNFNCLLSGSRPKYLSYTIKYVLPAAIRDFVSPIIKIIELQRHLIILNSEPLQILVRPLLDLALNFFIFLAIFKYFVLSYFITNPVLTAAFLIRATTSSVALTDRPSINTLSAFARHCLVLLKIVPFGLVSIFLITFSNTIFNEAGNC